MNRLWQAYIWLRRWNHCCGFGIQSPTDYYFARYVVGESCPYYAYETLGNGDHWLQRKLGRLYFRLANYQQPDTVTDMIQMEDYIQAACHKARPASPDDPIDMALLPAGYDYAPLLPRCHNLTMLVFHHIYNDRQHWQRIVDDTRLTVTFDLYYCGIAIIDHHRSHNHYIVNF